MVVGLIYVFLGSPLLRAITRRNVLVTKKFQQKLSRSGSFKIYVYCNKQKNWCDSFTQRTQQLREQMTLNTLLTGKPFHTYYDAYLPPSYSLQTHIALKYFAAEV
jgi:ABC-type protease/lipase transport system fused ATPase/permease subunit